ncbi:MAG: ABC transporter substrate-binding protein [Gammaproteobacteria bacterium]
MRVMRVVAAIGCALGLLWSLPAPAAERIVLQLKWEHEFQFAGYYAALWQGFYAREGLDVEIRSAWTEQGRKFDVQQEVMAGHAHFGVAGMDLLIDRGKGSDYVLVAPVFQRSAGALLALESTRLERLEDVAGLRIAVAAGDFINDELELALAANGLDTSRVQFVDAPLTLETLTSGKADAILTYAVSALVRARETGLELNVIYPGDFGLKTYGDVLFTQGALARERPDLVRRFRKATLEGWRYALENRYEVADRISADLPRHVYKYDDIGTYNRAFAALIDSYLYYPVVDIGQNDIERWRRVYRVLDQLGRIERPYDVRDLMFSGSRFGADRVIAIATTVAGLALLAMLLLAMRHRVPAMGLAVFVLLIVAEQLAERWHTSERLAREQLQTSDRINGVRTLLERSLTDSLSRVDGLAAFVSTNPDVGPAAFARYARAVVSSDEALRGLAVLEDFAIREVFPPPKGGGTAAADYFAGIERLASTRAALENDRSSLSGPVEPGDDDAVFVALAPVYVEETSGHRALRGLVAGAIGANAVYREAGLFDGQLGLEVALRRSDLTGTDGEVFYGRADVFADPLAVVLPVAAGDAQWLLAARPANVSAGGGPVIVGLRLAAIFIGCLLAAALHFLQSRERERRAHELALRRNELFMQEVGSVAQVGGWRMDGTRTITDISAQARHILGVGAEYATLEDFAASIDESGGRRLVDAVDGAVAGNRRMDIELPLSLPTGEARWVRLVGHPIERPGRAIEFIGAVQDITERKRVEQEQELLRDQLRHAQKMESIGLLTGGIAHDFNNVLASVLGFTSLALRVVQDKGPEKVVGYLGEIDVAARRARDIVRQLLAFSRPTSDAKGVVDLSMLVRESTRLLRSTVPATIEFSIDCASHPAHATGDEGKLQQVLMNLVINARDAIDGSTGAIGISVARRREEGAVCASCHKSFSGDFVVLTVSDDGPGIPESVRSRLFEPFYTTKAVGKGSGMGLAMVHGLIHAHHGHVLLPAVAAGTRFEVLLQIAEGPSQHDEAPAANADGTTAAGTGRARVLVVDEDPLVARLIRDVVAAEGIEGVMSTRADEALAMVRAEPGAFDCLVTAQGTSTIDGYQLVRAVRELRQDLPVIMLDDPRHVIDEKAATAAGIDACLSMPFDNDELLSLLHELLADSTRAARSRIARRHASSPQAGGRERSPGPLQRTA